MGSATFWNAVGSVGSAAGSVFAFFAIVLTAILYRRQRNDESAAEIREDMRAFVSAAARLNRVLRDGSLVISAAWGARSVIRESVPPNSDVNRLREVLKDGKVGLSVAIVSWERSSQTEALRGFVDTVVTSARRMTGNLSILSNAGELLVSMVDDSTMTFVRLLTNQGLVTNLLDSTKQISDSEELLNAVAQYLHSNTALYVSTRYEAALLALDQLVTEVAVAAGELNSARLVAVARAKSAITADRRTDEMQNNLVALGRFIPGATSEQIRQLIAQVEQDITKCLTTPPTEISGETT